MAAFTDLEELEKLIAAHEWQPRPKLKRTAAQVEADRLGFHDRAALLLTLAMGSMPAFYVFGLVVMGWVAWQVAVFHDRGFDPYPFAFLLFIVSCVQLPMMVVIMVGQNLQGRKSELRAEADFHLNLEQEREIEQIRSHMSAQDELLFATLQRLSHGRGFDPSTQTRAALAEFRELIEECRREPSAALPKNANQEALKRIRTQENIALAMTRITGSMAAFYFFSLLLVGWALVQTGILRNHGPDPYPYTFLLFISNLIQLLLFPLIIVGQNLQARHADLREETGFEVNQIAHDEVEGLIRHMTRQDRLLLKILSDVEKLTAGPEQAARRR